MFTDAQYQIINKRRYRSAFFLSLFLPTGFDFRWTSMPYDALGYESKAPIKGFDPIKAMSAFGDNSFNIEVIADMGIAAAFDNCQGANVQIMLGVQDLDTGVLETGYQRRFVINGAKKETRSDGQNIILEIGTFMNGALSSRPRPLTPGAQERLNGDKCLEMMAAAESTIYWGKE